MFNEACQDAASLYPIENELGIEAGRTAVTPNHSEAIASIVVSAPGIVWAIIDRHFMIGNCTRNTVNCSVFLEPKRMVSVIVKNEEFTAC